MEDCEDKASGDRANDVSTSLLAGVPDSPGIFLPSLASDLADSIGFYKKVNYSAAVLNSKLLTVRGDLGRILVIQLLDPDTADYWTLVGKSLMDVSRLVKGGWASFLLFNTRKTFLL